MQQQVRVAADRRGEVRVVRQRQAEVTAVGPGGTRACISERSITVCTSICVRPAAWTFRQRALAVSPSPPACRRRPASEPRSGEELAQRATFIASG